MKTQDLYHRTTSYLAGWLVHFSYILNHNAAKGTSKRLMEREEYLAAQHEAQTKARGIFALPTKMEDQEARDTIVRLVSGALRSVIYVHGPITKNKIGQAANRVAGELHAQGFKS